MTALLFDCETTGITEPQVVEVAYMVADDPRLPLGLDAAAPKVFTARYQPSKPIELGALAAHGIMDEDLVGLPPSSDFTLPAETQFIVGHQIDYDWEAAGRPEVRRICTLALARAKWPTLDSHRLTALLYHVDRANARAWLERRPPHSAAADVLLCRVLLHHLVPDGVESWLGLWKASEQARVPTHWAFGKHKGSAIADAPPDYREWVLRQPDMDPYVVKAVLASLGR